MWIDSLFLYSCIFNTIATWCAARVVKCLNDNEHDMIEVPKLSLNAVLHYLFYFYPGVGFAFS